MSEKQNILIQRKTKIYTDAVTTLGWYSNCTYTKAVPNYLKAWNGNYVIDEEMLLRLVGNNIF